MKAVLMMSCALVVAACTGATEEPEPTVDTLSSTTVTSPPPDVPRLIEATVAIEPDGATEPFEFEIPTGTRSVGITAVGGSSDVIAVTQLALGDGVDRVGVGRIPAALLENIAEQHLRIVPGDVFQEASTGIHTLVYPNAPGTGEIPAGTGSVRVSSTGRSVDLTILLAPETELLTLGVDVFVADPDVTLNLDSPALTRVVDLFAQADIVVEFRTVANVSPTERMAADVGVDSPLADLVEEASASGTDSLDVFVVPALDVSGFSPRIPGPLVQSPMRAVVVKATARPSDLGRVIAHEIGHYLGLHHLELYTDDHRPIPDQIPDTEPGTNNLMDAGTILTEGQIEVIRRSPLLEPNR